MRLVTLHDPHRRGTWLDELAPGDYPVFLRDAQTSAERNVEGKPLRRGEPGVCVVFGSFDEAAAFCQRTIREHPGLRCDIYDHRGLASPPLCTFGDREWDPKPRILMALAGACIVASAPLFWFDWHKHGEMILLSVIGINLVAAGVRFLFWGLGAIDDEHERSKSAAKVAAQPGL